MNEPDEIKYAGISERTKLKTIKYIKKIDNLYYYVEEVRKRRKKVAMKTLYKKTD